MGIGMGTGRLAAMRSAPTLSVCVRAGHETGRLADLPDGHEA